MSAIGPTGRGIQMGALLHIVNNMRQRLNEELRRDPLTPPLESLRNIDRETLQRIVFGDAPVTNIASTALGVYFVNHIAEYMPCGIGPHSGVDENEFFHRFVISLYDRSSGNTIYDNRLTRLLEFAIGSMFGTGVMSSIEQITDVASSAITPVATEALRIGTNLSNRLSRLGEVIRMAWNLSTEDPVPAIRPADIRRD